MKIPIKRMGAHSLPLPKYETKGAAGFDLRAVEFHGPYTRLWNEQAKELLLCSDIYPGERISFGCGFAFAIPDGYELQIRGRSGLARKGIVVVGGVGTVDSDFRAAPIVTLMNLSKTPFIVWQGDRIAQAVVAPVVQVEWNVVEDLGTTERGDGGFGSTGTK